MQPEQQEWESVMVETTFHNGMTSVGVDSLFLLNWLHSGAQSEINSTAMRHVVKR